MGLPERVLAQGRSGRGYIRYFLLNNGANLISGGTCGRESRLAARECEQRSDAYENQQRKEMCAFHHGCFLLSTTSFFININTIKGINHARIRP